MGEGVGRTSKEARRVERSVVYDMGVTYEFSSRRSSDVKGERDARRRYPHLSTPSRIFPYVFQQPVQDLESRESSSQPRSPAPVLR